jgi:hypothetical protein
MISLELGMSISSKPLLPEAVGVHGYLGGIVMAIPYTLYLVTSSPLPIPTGFN